MADFKVTRKENTVHISEEDGRVEYLTYEGILTDDEGHKYAVAIDMTMSEIRKEKKKNGKN